MMRHTHLQHRFVRSIPDQLQAGVLYVSMEFSTAAHSCCCGCGREVITPFSPTDWRLTFDGQAVSLWPSIGNWNLPCRSHYVISDGEVHEAGPWSPEQVEAERRRDKAAKARFYKTPIPPASLKPLMSPPESQTNGAGLFARVVRWLFG